MKIFVFASSQQALLSRPLFKQKRWRIFLRYFFSTVLNFDNVKKAEKSQLEAERRKSKVLLSSCWLNLNGKENNRDRMKANLMKQNDGNEMKIIMIFVMEIGCCRRFRCHHRLYLSLLA